MALLEIISFLWMQTKSGRKVLRSLCQLFLPGPLFIPHLFHFYSWSYFRCCFDYRTWCFCVNCFYWFDFFVKPLREMARLWPQYLTHPSSLPFFSAESGSGQVLVTWSLPLFFLPLTSVRPGSRGDSSWVVLNGIDPFTTRHRPLTNTTQEEETILQSQRSHLNRQHHFSWWQQTGSTNYVTWPSSPVLCTRSPLTPCGATPPLTYWPVATSLAGLGQTFPKRWLHCVSNTNYY